MAQQLLRSMVNELLQNAQWSRYHRPRWTDEPSASVQEICKKRGGPDVLLFSRSADLNSIMVPRVKPVSCAAAKSLLPTSSTFCPSGGAPRMHAEAICRRSSLSPGMSRRSFSGMRRPLSGVSMSVGSHGGKTNQQLSSPMSSNEHTVRVRGTAEIASMR